MTNMDLLERLGQVELVAPALVASTADALAAMAQPEAISSATHPLLIDRGDATVVTPHRRSRRTLVAAVSVAALAAALVVAGSTAWRPGTPKGPTSKPSSELGRLALTADSAPTLAVPGPGQFMYTSSVEAYTSSTFDGPGHSYTVVVPKTRQIWIGPDGSGRLVETPDTPIFLSPQDHADWVAAGSPSVAEAPSDQTFGPGGLSDGPTDLATLPTDPTALGALISSRQIEGGPPGPAEDFVQIGDLLRETDAPPALRAALFTVAERLPGIEEMGSVTDHAGRQGVGVAYTSGGSRHELIFNPADSSLMGEEDVITDATAQHEPVGTVDGWVVYLASAVVNSDDSLAASGAGSATGTAVQPAS
jgi:hypothetical protein